MSIITIQVEHVYSLVLLDGVEIGHVRQLGTGSWRATTYREPIRPIQELPTFASRAAAIAHVVEVDAR